MFHKHKWQDKERGNAIYIKGSWAPGHGVAAQGLIQSCSECPERRIVPDDKRLRPVEVEWTTKGDPNVR